MNVTTLVIAMSIPSATTAFCFWIIERKIEKNQKKVEKKEASRERNELFLIKTVQASLALGEATARAVQRIPDSHCNGDMHAALDYAAKVKHEQKDFLNEQAVQNII